MSSPNIVDTYGSIYQTGENTLREVKKPLEDATEEVAIKNLNLLAQFDGSKYLEINPENMQELILIEVERDECAWPIIDKIIGIVEFSFSFGKNRSEERYRLEIEALEGLNKFIEKEEKLNESSVSVQELKSLIEELEKRITGNFTQSKSLPALSEASGKPRSVQCSSYWPVAKPLSTIEEFPQEYTSPVALTGDQDVEKNEADDLDASVKN